MPDKKISAHTVPPISLRRRITDRMMTGVAVLTVILVLVPLFAIFAYLVYRGVGSINWAFLTQTPKPVGESGGGMANAIVGSVFILGLASVIGVPLGVGAGIYLAEFGRNRFGDSIRFTADVLNGVPSIVIGIVAYSIVVLYQKHFSALAGGVALAIMMIPNDHAYDGRDAAAGAAGVAGSCLRAGDFALADDSFHYAAHGDFGRDHGDYAGVCPGRGRNRASAIHGIREPVLESSSRPADRGVAAADFQLCYFSV